MKRSIDSLLVSQGYKLVEDAWDKDGRRSYVHDDASDRKFIRNLRATLNGAGWTTDSIKLRSFRHLRSGEIIEIEPGGHDTSGHFLHHMKEEPTKVNRV